MPESSLSPTFRKHVKCSHIFNMILTIYIHYSICMQNPMRLTNHFNCPHSLLLAHWTYCLWKLKLLKLSAFVSLFPVQKHQAPQESSTMRVAIVTRTNQFFIEVGTQETVAAIKRKIEQNPWDSSALTNPNSFWVGTIGWIRHGRLPNSD